MTWFYYLAPGDKPIRVQANKRPSERTKPKFGTWVVQEFDGINWHTPAFPEISWRMLSKAKYLGNVKQSKAGFLE